MTAVTENEMYQDTEGDSKAHVGTDNCPRKIKAHVYTQYWEFKIQWTLEI